MVKNPVMTTRELASYIKLNEKTVIRMAQNGKIPGVKIGNQWRFHLASIDRYLQADLMDSADHELDDILRTKKEVIPLSRLTGPSFIELHSPAATKLQVLKALAAIAHKGGVTAEDDRLYKDLKQREEMLSTAVGKGVAFPHSRHPSLKLFKAPKVVILRLKKGINFDAPDGRLVGLFFMPCAPDEFEHVRLLAEISKLLHVEGIVEKFLGAKTKEEVMRLLLEFDRKHLAFRRRPDKE